MNFNDIIGQRDVTQSLLNAIRRDRIGHAWLFSGPAGIGKRMVAGIFAGLLLCGAPQGDRVCGGCQACMLYENGSNPDFLRVAPEGASIGIDEIRRIQGDVSIKPMYSKRKVYVIENADRMTAQAQNCLLKTLEEPPPFAVILLTVENYEAMLETVRSRVLRLNFKKNAPEEVQKAVRMRFPQAAGGLEFITAYADGRIGVALELAGSGEFMQLRDKTMGMLSGIKSKSLSSVLESASFFEENKDSVELVLDIMTSYYRDLLVARETGNENILINSDKKDMIFINAKAYGPRKLLADIEQIGAAGRALKQNANYQLAIDHMLIKLQED